MRFYYPITTHIEKQLNESVKCGRSLLKFLALLSLKMISDFFQFTSDIRSAAECVTHGIINKGFDTYS